MVDNATRPMSKSGKPASSCRAQLTPAAFRSVHSREVLLNHLSRYLAHPATQILRTRPRYTYYNHLLRAVAGSCPVLLRCIRRICAFNRSWVHQRWVGAVQCGVMSVTSGERTCRTGEGSCVTGPKGRTKTREATVATCSLGTARPGCTTRLKDQGQFYELLHIVLVVLLCFSRCSAHSASLRGEPLANSAATKVTTIMPRLHSNYDYTNTHKHKHDEKEREKRRESLKDTTIYRA